MHRSPPPASPVRSLRAPRATGAWRAAACALAAAFVLLLGAGAAQAQTAVKLVSNTGQSSVFSGLNADYAQAFTTGSNDAGYAGYKLTRVDLRMRDGGGTTPVYTVSIHSDSSNSPGTSLGTLTQQGSVPSTTGPVRFNASGDGIDLAANTRYWLVLDVSTVNASWEARITDAGADAEDSGGAAGWSIADTLIWRSHTRTSWASPNTHLSSVALAIHGHAKPRKPALAWHKAEVNGATVTLFFDSRLKHGATPGKTAFSFNTPSGGTFQPAAAPTVFSNTVTIQARSTGSPFKHGETVRLAYTPPSSTANRLQGRTGGFVDAIPQWLDVVNVTPPAFSSATVNGATLVLTFDGGLWDKSVPKASAFTVRRTRSGSTSTVRLAEPNPVAVRGRTVTLSLSEAVVRTDTLTVAYTAPASPSIGAKLRDADNDQLPVPGFTAQSGDQQHVHRRSSGLVLQRRGEREYADRELPLGHELRCVS